MRLLRAIHSAIVNAFNFRGRGGRTDFWIWLLFVILVWFVALYLDLTYIPPMLGYMPMEQGAPRPLSIGWALLCIIPTLSLMVRRMHDHDRSGWWLLSVLPAIWWLATKGMKGPNRYG